MDTNKISSCFDTDVLFPMNKEQVRNNVGLYRKEKGMTQRELAKTLKTSTANIGGYECGSRRLTLPMIFALAEYFRVTVNDLMGLPSYQQLLSLQRHVTKAIIPSDKGFPVDEGYAKLTIQQKAWDYKFPCRNLQAIRKVARVKRPELGSVINATPIAIKAWEYGAAAPSFEQAMNMAMYFGVTINQLMGVPEWPIYKKRKKNVSMLGEWGKFFSRDEAETIVSIVRQKQRDVKNGKPTLISWDDMIPRLQRIPPKTVKVVIIVPQRMDIKENAGGKNSRIEQNLIKAYNEGYLVQSALDSDLDLWAERGVLILYTKTCKTPGFTRANYRNLIALPAAVVRACSDSPQPVVFVLFGREAMQVAQVDRISQGPNNKVIQLPGNWVHREDEPNLLEEINKSLSELGGGLIDWRLFDKTTALTTKPDMAAIVDMLGEWGKFFPRNEAEKIVSLVQQKQEDVKSGKPSFITWDDMIPRLQRIHPKTVKVVIIVPQPMEVKADAERTNTRIVRNLIKAHNEDYFIQFDLDGDLSLWAERGILILYPKTCRPSEMALPRAIVRACSDSPQPVVFVLFGKEAMRVAQVDRISQGPNNKVIQLPGTWSYRSDAGPNLLDEINASLFELGGGWINWRLFDKTTAPTTKQDVAAIQTDDTLLTGQTEEE